MAVGLPIVLWRPPHSTGSGGYRSTAAEDGRIRAVAARASGDERAMVRICGTLVKNGFVWLESVPQAWSSVQGKGSEVLQRAG